MALKSERRFISRDNIKSGMMLEFSYTKENGDTNSYEVIVIDPKKSMDNKLYLHAILLENMSDEEIIRIAIEFGGTVNFDPDERTAPLTNLQSDQAYNRYKTSTTKNKRVYRTFLLNRISGTPRQILIGRPE